MAPLLVFLLVICVSAKSFHGTASKDSKGFSLSIIPIFSKESPFYQANLTREDILCRISDARALWLSSSYNLSSSGNTTSPDIVRPKIQNKETLYIVRVDIGSPSTAHYLQFDTGSSLIWVQCEGCNPCFNIKANFSFNWRRSMTFHYLSCYDPLCIPRVCSKNNKCLYEIGYVDGDRTKGTMATDRFGFPSSDPTRQSEFLNGIVFGCGTNNTVLNFPGGDNNIIAGILGMGRTPQSFISQLGAQAQTEHRFSYCLPDVTKPEETHGFLRFGSDADIGEGDNVKSTPLLYYWPVMTRMSYYVVLHGIIVDGKRLPIPEEVFKIKGQTGGVCFDVGIAFSYLYPAAYYPLQDALDTYFSKFGLNKINMTGFKLCYERPNGFMNFPSLQFQFNGAVWDVRPGAAFFIEEAYFCSSIEPTSEATTSWEQFFKPIIGSYMICKTICSILPNKTVTIYDKLKKRMPKCNFK